jgi:hypothetical protein
MTWLEICAWVGLGATSLGLAGCSTSNSSATTGNDGGDVPGSLAPIQEDGGMVQADASEAANPNGGNADAGRGSKDAGAHSTDGGGASDASSRVVDAALPTGENGSICPAVPAGDTETYGLPPTTNLPSGVTAMTSWTQNPGSGGWNGRQVKDACRYEADPGGFVTSHGMLSARVEVDPGDDPLDLGENTERAEMLDLQDATGMPIAESSASGTQYYATSYYFPTTWGATFYPWSAFEASGSTWPAGSTSDCSSGNGNECNSWSFVMQLYPWAALAAASAAPGQPQTMWLSAGSQTFQFSDGGQLALGQWMDIVIQVDWTSGAIGVWRRNEGQASFTQVVNGTTGSAPPSGVYSKQGIYRGGNVNGRTDVYWVGPTARGSTFAAVELAAFGTNSGP